MIGTYLVDNIILRKHNGTDVWQEPDTASDEPLKAFIDYGERRIQNEMGEIVTSTAKVLMRPRTLITSGFATRAAKTISYKDKIVFDDFVHGIVQIGKQRDFSVRSMVVYVT